MEAVPGIVAALDAHQGDAAAVCSGLRILWGLADTAENQVLWDTWRIISPSPACRDDRLVDSIAHTS